MTFAVLLVHWAIRAYILALIVRAVLSWVAPMNMHPAVLLLNRFTDPVLLPIRGAIGIHSGVDFSPVIAIVVLSIVDGLILSVL